jgi:hypothetical protein
VADFAFIEEIAAAIDFSRHAGYYPASERPQRPTGADDLFASDTLRRMRCLSALDLARDIEASWRPTIAGT